MPPPLPVTALHVPTHHTVSENKARISLTTTPCTGGLKIEGEDESYDFGSGAGFYVDATKEPWAKNYKMYTYITQELPKALFAAFDQLDTSNVAITGHSMGGHGALTLVSGRPSPSFPPHAGTSPCGTQRGSNRADRAPLTRSISRTRACTSRARRLRPLRTRQSARGARRRSRVTLARTTRTHGPPTTPPSSSRRGKASWSCSSTWCVAPLFFLCCCCFLFCLARLLSSPSRPRIHQSTAWLTHLSPPGHRRQFLQAEAAAAGKPCRGRQERGQGRRRAAAHAARLRSQLLLHGVVCRRPRQLGRRSHGCVVSRLLLTRRRQRRSVSRPESAVARPTTALVRALCQRKHEADNGKTSQDQTRKRQRL